MCVFFESIYKFVYQNKDCLSLETTTKTIVLALRNAQTEAAKLEIVIYA